MRPSVIFVLVIQFVLIAQCGKKLVLADSGPALELDNEIPLESNDGDDNDDIPFHEKYALLVKSQMNTSVNPCDDFYEYACGNYPNVIQDLGVNFERSNPIDIFLFLTDIVNKTLQKTRHPDDEYYEEIQIARQLLNSCVNTKLYPMQPHKEYLEVLNTIGGFPAIDPTWNASNFDWFKMTSHLVRYQIEGLVKEQNGEKYPYAPTYELPKLGFNFDIYSENIETKESEGYVYSEKVMRDLLKIYGVTDTKADSVVEGVIEFWREALSLDKTIKEHINCKILDLANGTFRKVFPKWSSLFDIAWGLPNAQIADCPCVWYYNQLDKIAAEKPEAVANYLALKFLFSLYPYTMKLWESQDLNCLIQVRLTFPMLVSQLYVKEHYDKHIEEDIDHMITELKHSLEYLIATADWLDNSTKQEAQNKMAAMKSVVGYIDHPISDILIREMKKLNLTDNYATNNLEIRKFNIDVEHYYFLHEEIPEDTPPLRLLDSAQMAVFYYFFWNKIYTMVGIMYPPAYHRNLPSSINYGGLGYTIGHHLTHGVDIKGSLFNSNLTERFWWSLETTMGFLERSKCFVNQYDGFDVPELNMHINGTNTLFENIADSGGLRVALNAYREVSATPTRDNEVDRDLENALLPGLDLDSEQLFFLSFAQFHCSKYEPKDFWNNYFSKYSLFKYRVLGPLQNFEEFSRVYNCPLGSPMNPERKCRLW